MKTKEIDVADILLIAILGAGLLMAIYQGASELSTNIASGLIGYMAKTAVVAAKNDHQGGF